LPFECIHGQDYDIWGANGETPNGLEAHPECQLICSCTT
jgi:hypothetical protein